MVIEVKREIPKEGEDTGPAKKEGAGLINHRYLLNLEG